MRKTPTKRQTLLGAVRFGSSISPSIMMRRSMTLTPNSEIPNSNPPKVQTTNPKPQTRDSTVVQGRGIEASRYNLTVQWHNPNSIGCLTQTLKGVQPMQGPTISMKPETLNPKPQTLTGVQPMQGPTIRMKFLGKDSIEYNNMLKIRYRNSKP